MQFFFTPVSYQIKNSKWIPTYYKVIGNKYTNEKKVLLEGEFDTKEEADKHVDDYCFTQGMKRIVKN